MQIQAVFTFNITVRGTDGDHSSAVAANTELKRKITTLIKEHSESIISTISKEALIYEQYSALGFADYD